MHAYNLTLFCAYFQLIRFRMQPTALSLPVCATSSYAFKLNRHKTREAPLVLTNTSGERTGYTPFNTKRPSPATEDNVLNVCTWDLYVWRKIQKGKNAKGK